jgi:hypothetical protein
MRPQACVNACSQLTYARKSLSFVVSPSLQVSLATYAVVTKLTTVNIIVRHHSKMCCLTMHYMQTTGSLGEFTYVHFSCNTWVILCWYSTPKNQWWFQTQNWLKTPLLKASFSFYFFELFSWIEQYDLLVNLLKNVLSKIHNEKLQ